MSWFWKFYLRNWKVDLFPTEIKKCVIAVGPHTSNEDFIMGLALRSVMKIHGAKFLAKSELFKGAFGVLFRGLGGTPVYRKHKTNMVEQVTEQFNQHQYFRLAISPEGTRTKVDKLRTGFYHIAKQANVPIVMIGFDYENKHAICSAPFYVTDNEVADFNFILEFFKSIKGKFPEKGIEHLSYHK